MASPTSTTVLSLHDVIHCGPSCENPQHDVNLDIWKANFDPQTLILGYLGNILAPCFFCL
jgi:hypothetical protein